MVDARQSPVNTAVARSPSPVDDHVMDPELARYLNRTYWESKQSDDPDRPASPSAPSPLQSKFNLSNSVTKIEKIFLIAS